MRGANFNSATAVGFTAATLYSTASYQNQDLSGIDLAQNDLTGWNFAGQNLTNASFGFAYLAGTNFTGAEVRGANFISLNHNNGFTAAQLYSTASYQNHDLTGINLVANNMPGWNFSGQNLTSANFRIANLADADFSYANLTGAQFGNPFEANLTGANFSHANLANAVIGVDNLTNTNFTGADTRGALLLPDPTSITTNLIRYNGHVAGLDLTGGQSLLVRNYHGNPFEFPPIGPLPIVIDQHLTMDASGVLKLVFDTDVWDSEISFAPGIPVTLGGTLELDFAAGTDVDAQIGRTFQIFDWTGVAPAGAFGVSSAYGWDLSKLYTSGQVTLVPEPTSLGLSVLCGACLARPRRRAAPLRRAVAPRDPRLEGSPSVIFRTAV